MSLAWPDSPPRLSTRRAAPGAGRGQALLLAGLLLVLGTACSGYPSEDLPSQSPFTMDSSARLDAMNALGEQPRLERRWHYRLADACTLQVGVRPASDKAPVHSMPLRGATLMVKQNSERGLHWLALVPDRADEADAQALLESPRWTDAVELFSHVQSLQADCVRLTQGPRTTPPDTGG